ncbi:unnamed protein product, partial [Rhizoctonia solani]
MKQLNAFTQRLQQILQYGYPSSGNSRALRSSPGLCKEFIPGCLQSSLECSGGDFPDSIVPENSREKSDFVEDYSPVVVSVVASLLTLVHTSVLLNQAQVARQPHSASSALQAPSKPSKYRKSSSGFLYPKNSTHFLTSRRACFCIACSCVNPRNGASPDPVANSTIGTS